MDFVTMKPETLKWIIIGFFMLFAFVSVHFNQLKAPNNHEEIKPSGYVWLGFILFYLFFF